MSHSELRRRLSQLREQIDALVVDVEASESVAGQLEQARRQLRALLDEVALQERQLAEELDQQRQTLFDDAVDGVVTIDELGEVQSFNLAAERLFGWSAAEIIGCNVRQLMPSPYREEHDGYLEAYRKTGEAKIIGVGREVVGRRRDGTTFPLELGVSEIRVGGERQFLGILRDITERREAELGLRRQRDFADRLIQTMPAIVALVRAGGSIVRYNCYLAELSGHELPDVRGESFARRFVARRHRPRFAQALAAAGEGSEVGVSSALVTVLETRERDERTVEWHFRRLGDYPEVDEPVVLIIGLDITDREQLLEEFLQLQKLEAVGRLATGIAHDFNNLLMGIMGCSALAARKIEPESPARTYLDEIHAGAERGAQLTRQLLDFSRRRPDRVTAARRCSINRVVETTEQMLRQVIGEDVDLRVELAATDGEVSLDFGQVEQILMNLAANARDAMPRGGTLVIRTELAGPGTVALEVSDTGEGMTRETQERAFEPFFTTKPQGQGTGLGLSTVYGIVQRAGGRIEMTSALGEGASFRLHLPLAAGFGAGELDV